MYLKDNKAGLNVEIYFDFVKNGFFDRISGKKIEGSNWLGDFKINTVKYVILSSIMNEVFNEMKLFADPIKVAQLNQIETIRKARLKSFLKSNLGQRTYSSPGCPTTFDCQSGVHYNWDRTRCCAEAHSDVTQCCGNSFCLDCCQYAGCNFGGVFGDFLGICTEWGSSCASYQN